MPDRARPHGPPQELSAILKPVSYHVLDGPNASARLHGSNAMTSTPSDSEAQRIALNQPGSSCDRCCSRSVPPMGLRDRLEHLAASAVRTVVTDEADRQVFASGMVHSRLQSVHRPLDLREAEYRVFSQWNEDGVINWLTDSAGDVQEKFVEIGVEDYAECNTRFLAMRARWSGMAVDAGTAHHRSIARWGLDWRYGVTAVSAFVTAGNINDIIGGDAEVGLLSIDVDGQDYWLLQAARLRAAVLIVEYNSVFGADHAITVPQQADFCALKAHDSGQYFGASLGALTYAAEHAGYRLVGCESHGANAFFVRKGLAPNVPTRTVRQAYVRSRFRTSRTLGKLDYEADHEVLLRRLRHEGVVDVTSGTSKNIARVFGL